MSNEKKIKKTLNFLKLNPKKLAILHCVSEYPTSLKNTYLGYLQKLKKLNYCYGISDHTIGSEFAVASISMGARIIEKHITLSKNQKGPDHKASLEVKDLFEFVRSIRNISSSLKKENRYETKIEKENLNKTQRKIFFKVNKKKNEKIKYDDILPLRSNKKNIINVKDVFRVIGKKTKFNQSKGSSIQWKKIK